jgi:hypothetical protein
MVEPERKLSTRVDSRAIGPRVLVCVRICATRHGRRDEHQRCSSGPPARLLYGVARGVHTGAGAAVLVDDSRISAFRIIALWLHHG